MVTASLHYLTVQDVLWINLQVTKKVQHFNFALLEEAVYFQYAYGESTGLIPQAARLLTGFVRLRPLAFGNAATAFVACLAFLRINGKTLRVSDDEASGWFEELWKKKDGAQEMLGQALVDTPDFHPTIKPDIRGAITSVLTEYGRTIAALQDESRFQTIS